MALWIKDKLPLLKIESQSDSDLSTNFVRLLREFVGDVAYYIDGEGKLYANVENLDKVLFIRQIGTIINFLDRNEVRWKAYQVHFIQNQFGKPAKLGVLSVRTTHLALIMMDSDAKPIIENLSYKN